MIEPQKEPTVGEYFEQQLGRTPIDFMDDGTDVPWPACPLNTPCGEMIAAVIRAASTYLHVADPCDDVRDPFFQSVNTACEILWRG